MLKSVILSDRDLPLLSENFYHKFNSIEVALIMQSIANHPQPIIDPQSRQEILEGFLKRVHQTSLLTHSTRLRSIK